MTTRVRRLRAAALAAALVLVVPVLLPTSTLADKPNSKGNASNKGPDATPPDLSADDDDGNTAGVQVQPNSDTTRTVNLDVDVDDGNGHADISSCDVTVYEPDNSTVHVSSFSTSKGSGNGKTATYSGSFNMEYWDPAGVYHVKNVCQDRKSSSDTSWTTFEYTNLTSMSLNMTTASFDDGDGDGKLEPGDVTHSTPVNMTIENTGNVEIDISFDGTDATDGNGNKIDITNLHMDADQDNDFSTNEWTFKTTTQTVTDFNLAPSTDGTASTTYLLFAIHIPEVPKGTYTGSMTLEAVRS